MLPLCRTAVAVLLLLAASLPLHAQSTTRDVRQSSPPRMREAPLWESWLKLHGHFYENFFQAPEGRTEEDIAAGLAEIGTSLRLSRTYPLRAFASVNYLQFDESDLDSTQGVRVGLRSQARPHAFEVYGDFQNDRPTFDVGDEFDRADIRTFAGEYSLRFAGDWQLSADGELQKQEFELTPSRDNDFSSIGGALRYRGSRAFSPEIGVRFGNRDVDDPTFSYDQRDVYLQIRSSLPRLYLSVRYRMRDREYTTGDVTASNFGREDDRRQIAAAADVTLSDLLVLNLYASNEDTDTNLQGRDFETSMYVAGVTFRF